jgi:hypothetical protein
MESISTDAILIHHLKITLLSTLSRNSSCIAIIKINILVSSTYMLTLREKESSFMVMRPMSFKNKFRFACSQRYYLWIVKYLSIMAVILHKRICTAKMWMIMHRNKELAELLYLKPLKIHTPGLFSATTTPVEC